ncbi:MAG: cytochrome B6 [Nodosilinea sp.]
MGALAFVIFLSVMVGLAMGLYFGLRLVKLI